MIDERYRKAHDISNIKFKTSSQANEYMVTHRLKRTSRKVIFFGGYYRIVWRDENESSGVNGR